MQLNSKISLSVIGILAASLLISTLYLVNTLRKHYTNALITGTLSTGHGIESFIDEVLALDVPLNTLPNLNQRLQKIVKQNGLITYIGIADLDGTAIFHSDPDVVGRKFSDQVAKKSLTTSEPLSQLYNRFDGKEYYDISIPLFSAHKKRIGVLRLGFETEIINQKVSEASWQILRNITIAFLVIALILNVFLRRTIVDPVTQLARYAREISENHLSQPEPVRIHSKNEIGILSRALTDMGNSLNNQIKALQNSEQILESTVAQRTQDLVDANRSLKFRNQELIEALEREQELSEALRLSEERFRALFENSQAVMLLIDKKSASIITANTAASQYYGYPISDLKRMSIHDISTLTPVEVEKEQAQAHKEQRQHLYSRHRLASGSIRDVEVHIGLIDWQGHQVQFAIIHDITDRKLAESKLDHMAHYDALTGLPNRILLADRLRQALVHSRRKSTKLAVCYLDLDGFKPINDTHGHETGDQVLIEVAARLKQALREEDTVSRIGGDEFILILNDLNNVDECQQGLDRILAALTRPFQIGGILANLSASIGITLYPDDQADGDILLRHADQAMYIAKAMGKNRYHLFNPELDRELKVQRETYQRLREALAREELLFHYQPKINMTTGQVIGAEALIRWQHPEKGLLAPAQFLSIMEGNELEISIGTWVIHQALKQLEAWHQKHPELTLSINISPYHLQHPDFMPRLHQAIKQHPNADPHKLELEILESSSIEDNNDILPTLVKCHELGLKVALDDFGTGYSSLVHFHRLPIDNLKVDQNFVKNMLDNPQDLAIVRSTIKLAQTFQNPVIAEGVENRMQAAALGHLGCQFGQGYGIAYPMPIAEFNAWLEKSEWSELPHYQKTHQQIEIDVAITSHRNWAQKMIEFIEFDTPHRESLHIKSTLCPFGRWFLGSGFQQFGEYKEYRSVQAQHERVHQIADELVKLHDSRQRERAIDTLGEFKLASQELIHLLDQLAEASINDPATTQPIEITANTTTDPTQLSL